MIMCICKIYVHMQMYKYVTKNEYKIVIYLLQSYKPKRVHQSRKTNSVRHSTPQTDLQSFRWSLQASDTSFTHLLDKLHHRCLEKTYDQLPIAVL